MSQQIVIHTIHEAHLKRCRTFFREALLVIALAACGSEHPVAPPDPEPPSAVVDWVGLERLYDDPLYRRLPLLLDDESVARSLDEAMSALVVAIGARDLDGVEQAISRIRDARVVYAGGPGSDRHEEPQLLALSVFELRGMAYIRYDSLQTRDALLTIEEGP